MPEPAEETNIVPERDLNFPAPSPLGQGYAWTARFSFHDVYRHMMFIFELTLRKDGQLLRRYEPVYLNDYDYDTPGFALSLAGLRAELSRELEQEAREWMRSEVLL